MISQILRNTVVCGELNTSMRNNVEFSKTTVSNEMLDDCFRWLSVVRLNVPIHAGGSNG